MDLVSRLKFFMNSIGLTSSQFADTAGIPRPTLSQLLTGRNKKVSDELITKIHEAFPALSISWLMFGEGEMMTTANNRFSEPQNDDFSAQFDVFSSENQPINTPKSSSQNFPQFPSENSNGQERLPFSEISIESGKERTGNKTPLSVNVTSATGKRITNIVVFYDDNSFESFSPA